MQQYEYKQYEQHSHMQQKTNVHHPHEFVRLRMQRVVACAFSVCAWIVLGGCR